MNICYLLYRENIFSPLVEGQVLNILYKNSKKNSTIHFIWLKRVDYYFRSRHQIEATEKRMIGNGIVVHEIPIIVGKFPLNESMSNFVFAQVHKKINRIIEENNIEIVHTRGYDAAYLITKMREEGSFKALHVFDPRSPFLTEMVSTYHITPKDAVYTFWEKYEGIIVSNANATVATSSDFGNYLKKYGGNIVIIPNNSEMDLKQNVINRIEKQNRNSLCFVGSLGYGWNNIKEYISFMEKVWELYPDLFLELYILNQDIAKKELNEANISPDKYLIKTLPQSEVTKTISGCIAGLQIMSRPDSRLGIKTVDYLAAGVPVICNNNAQGAASIIRSFNVGWNIDETSIEEIIEHAKKDSDIRIKAYDTAYSNFSTDVVSESYYELYLKLLK